MAIDQNKDVVRRFINEVLIGGQLDRIDEVLAPDYVNRAFGVDLAGFKGLLSGLMVALPERHFDIEELIAEGDAVVARYTNELRDASGTPISVRGLTYYRLRDGRIVEDDPITSPDLAAALGGRLAPATA
jgi:predicted SnoaL-like aldol condensation-catalyzing enzyme